MSKPRIGFVGAGFIANVHAGILARDGRAEVHAVFDTDAQASALFALKTGARVLPSLDDLLGAVDVVYICNPNALHADTAVAALDGGLHVFSEKPMATSGGDARRVLAASQRARGVYQAGFNRRFSGVYAAVKARIESGALVPTSALLKMNRGELRSPVWTSDPAISGGFLYETPVHMLDMARFLLGEVAEMTVRARATTYEQLDDFSMLLAFESGVAATLTACAHATWLFPFERIELYGDHAIAATEEMERATFASGLEAPAETLDFARQPLERRWGYEEEDRRFLDAVLGLGAPAVDAEDAYRTTALVHRAYEAAR